MMVMKGDISHFTSMIENVIFFAILINKKYQIIFLVLLFFYKSCFKLRKKVGLTQDILLLRQLESSEIVIVHFIPTGTAAVTRRRGRSLLLEGMAFLCDSMLRLAQTPMQGRLCRTWC